MSNKVIEQLLSERNRLSKRRGGWIAGQGVFSYGKDLMRDMLPNKSYFHVLVLNALGFVPEDRFCRWLEASYICVSWPDPRIWCNGVGALAGSSKTTTLTGTVAGVLASDSIMYGSFTMPKATNYIQYALREINNGVSVEAFIESEVAKTSGKVQMMGFARPIATGDERVEAMLSLSESIGYEVGPHLELALKIEKYLLDNYKESMNITGYASAFLSDLGLNAEQVYSLYPIVVNSGVTACYLEQRAKPDDSYLPLTCDDIEYIGPAPRTLPEEYKNKLKREDI